MVCFRYIIVNILHKGDGGGGGDDDDDDNDNNNDDDDNNNDNNNNNNKHAVKQHVLAEIGHCQLVHTRECW